MTFPLAFHLQALPRLLALAGLLAGSVAAQATSIYDNLGAAQEGADPVLSAGPLANSFASGAQASVLNTVQLLLKSDSDALVGDLQLELLADNASAPGAVLGTVGHLSSADVSTSAFAAYSFNTAYLLSANTSYWLRLSSADPVAVEWSWSSDLAATGVAGQASYSQILGVVPNASGAAYQMLVGVSAPVPEPAAASLWLLGLALAGLAAQRKLKR
jgi:hypothetical protein